MSKGDQARVREELLQTLYRSVLRCEMTRAAYGWDPRGAGLDAQAAGLCAVLRPEDLLLLPARGAESFRLLRGGRPALPWGLAEHRAGIAALPRGEAAAVAFAFGAAVALARKPSGGLVCAVVPRAARRPDEAGRGARTRPQTCPQSWPRAAEQAARLGLPLLLLGSRSETPREPAPGPPGGRQAPLYPTICVDAEDTLALYRVAYECAARARGERGCPSWIAAVPFAPVGPGEPAGALPRLEAMLRGRGAFSKAWQQKVEQSLTAELTC